MNAHTDIKVAMHLQTQTYCVNIYLSKNVAFAINNVTIAFIIIKLLLFLLILKLMLFLL